MTKLDVTLKGTASFAAIAVMLCGVAAMAQTADAGNSGPSQQVPSAATADQAPSDIVVTARLREERAIDVPVAVSVLTGEEIQRYNSDSIQRITQNVPGLVVGSTVGLGGGSIAIREIGRASCRERVCQDV